MSSPQPSSDHISPRLSAGIVPELHRGYILNNKTFLDHTPYELSPAISVFGTGCWTNITTIDTLFFSFQCYVIKSRFICYLSIKFMPFFIFLCILIDSFFPWGIPLAHTCPLFKHTQQTTTIHDQVTLHLLFIHAGDISSTRFLHSFKFIVFLSTMDSATRQALLDYPDDPRKVTSYWDFLPLELKVT